MKYNPHNLLCILGMFQFWVAQKQCFQEQISVRKNDIYDRLLITLNQSINTIQDHMKFLLINLLSICSSTKYEVISLKNNIE